MYLKVKGRYRVHSSVTRDVLISDEELRFPLLPNAIPDPILITNSEGEIYYVNAAWEKLTGYSFKEVQGKNPRILNSGKTDKTIYKKLWQKLSKGKTFSTEKIIDRSKDGKEYRVRSVFFPIRRNGKNLFYVQVQHDITERKKLEEKVTLLKERYEGIFNWSKDAIAYVNLDGKLEEVNKAFISLTGYSKKELLSGITYHDLTPKEYHEKERKLTRRLQRTGKPNEYEKEYIRKDGRRVPIALTGFLVRDSKRNINGYAAIIRDISKQKAAENALKVSEKKYRDLMNKSSEGIMLFDLHGNIVEVNRKICVMLGYTKKELTAKNQSDILDPIEQRKHAIRHKQILAGKTIQGERIIVRKGGKRIIVEIIAKKISSDIVQVLYRDITERKRTEEKKDTFIGIAAHELKTPVTAIKAYGQLLSQTFERSHDQATQTYISSLNDQIFKLTQLIDDLLNVNKIESGTFEIRRKATGLRECIYQTIQSLRPIYKSHAIYVKGKITKKVYVDENKIAQVLSNLIANAVKYSPKADKVLIHMKTKGKSVVIGIQDFGFGIDKNDQQKIFDLFYRTQTKEQSNISGFGLGLYIASEIIKKHGGKLWVESEKGKGSTFYFTLPTVS